MKLALDQWKSQLITLSPSERVELAHFLLTSIELEEEGVERAWDLEASTRKVRLRRFPYLIYYVELDDSLWIAAVAHQKRRPGYWSHRRVELEGTS
jgi:hypothetical protein